jgi:hypothetical protein
VQLVAFVLVHVSVDEAVTAIVVGFALSVTVGGGTTVIVTV